MTKRIIHIVGLQKSGTSLLVRLLENTGHAQFLDGRGKTEGGIDWGNRPAFSPTGWPAGTIYQRSGGANGHAIEADDATTDICAAIREQTAARLVSVPTQFGISKIPYDMVRLPWVRAVIPELFIVGIVRRPVPNVFSLWKRFQPKAGTSGPEEGWWGVKPRDWRNLVSEDKIAQIANQWNHCNRKMWKNKQYLDKMVTYDEICSSPVDIVRSILLDAGGENATVSFGHGALPSCDDEYVRGARLLPRRREWVDTNELVLSPPDVTELDPFTIDQIATVESICGETTQVMGLECK